MIPSFLFAKWPGQENSDEVYNDFVSVLQENRKNDGRQKIVRAWGKGSGL